MSYQVLARKWRPKTFEELVGQTHVVRALVNGIENGRLHHAFLFTGTRGVGKTTIARILAKCLNCEQGETAKPCGECSSCVDIDEGRFVDMLEIDAASRTKVDDTRDLLDNVQYMPSRGRYKVYIIDEVHMLSTASFNALLKTLEEPPEHVKFVLATTDAHKIPVTILSRCLQFNLQNLLPAEIQDSLESILKAEGVEFEPLAVAELARFADGSMRDALSMLDQAIAYGGGSVVEQDVRSMLGSVERGSIYQLLKKLIAGDADGLLQEVEKLAGLACNFDRLLTQLAEALHRIALLQQAPGFRDESRVDWQEISALSEQLEQEDVQLFYQIAVHARKDLPLAPDPRSGLEMGLLRMLAFRLSNESGQPGSDAGPASEKPAVESTSAAEKKASPAMVAHPRPDPDTASEPRKSAPLEDISLAETSWQQTLDRLPIQGAVRELARNIKLARRESDIWYFDIPQQLVHLGSAKRTGQLASALGEATGHPVQIRLHPSQDSLTTPAALENLEHKRQLSEAELAIQDDPTVKALQDQMNARIVPDSIEPIQ